SSCRRPPSARSLPGVKLAGIQKNFTKYWTPASRGRARGRRAGVTDKTYNTGDVLLKLFCRNKPPEQLQKLLPMAAGITKQIGPQNAHDELKKYSPCAFRVPPCVFLCTGCERE
ncbi:MAG: hypothetical protein JW929_01140, partial [Anaerolineales bacterium]|nr:hypothetical protein [Anaerolineales bacterium]